MIVLMLVMVFAVSGPVVAAEPAEAAQLGRQVIALRNAIENPNAPNAMRAVTDLGRDQRNYVMVRGWLSYQLRLDTSILDNTREQVPDELAERIAFLKKAIRAIDLE
jgi:hypothetical protein